MVLCILTRKRRVACQNKYSWKSIWILDLKVLQNCPWVGSSKYGLKWTFLGELRLKLHGHFALKALICNKQSYFCLETDKVELQLLISVQRLFHADGFDFNTRQHSFSNMLVKAAKSFEWNQQGIEAPLQTWQNTNHATMHIMFTWHLCKNIADTTDICCKRWEPIACSFWKIFHTCKRVQVSLCSFESQDAFKFGKMSRDWWQCNRATAALAAWELAAEVEQAAD